MSDEPLRCVSPVDGRVYVERPAASDEEIRRLLAEARDAERTWKETSLDERRAVCAALLDALDRRRDGIAEQLAWQMGRPRRYGPSELRGVRERVECMNRLAVDSLGPVSCEGPSGFTRFIRREPVGTVMVIAPWNYPYLTAVNAIVPALLAGNAVILKHSTQTMLCAEHFAESFAEAGLPEGVFGVLHCSHERLGQLLSAGEVDHVAFTGSVEGGLSVQRSLAGTTAGLGLELGGKDPAYVRDDADIEHAAVNLADGAFFNSGQSCCGIERIYVHESIAERFVDAFVAETKKLVLGDPLDDATTLGPLVRVSAAEMVRGQIDSAVRRGARVLLSASDFPAARRGLPYLAPQVLVNVDHSMEVMTRESFGPVVGIQTVSDDAAAVALMNDSDYGLTASVWTRDVDRARQIGEAVNTGTFFMNRCDYLDPELAWTGVKLSGRGSTLSRFGFDAFVRQKSFHLRHG